MDFTNSFSAICDMKKMEIIASQLAKKLTQGSIVTLSGDLGSGKTTFTRMLCKHLLVDDIVSSPTFGYMNIYDDKIAHFDLYRLKTEEDFFSLGFEAYLETPYISIIEWPELILPNISKDRIDVTFSHHKNNRRISFNEKVLI